MATTHNAQHPAIDPVTGFVTVRIPDPMDSLPPRAGRQHGQFHVHPHWSPLTVSAPRGPKLDRSDWKPVGVQAIEPVHHVTFRRAQSTFSFLSRKNGFTQTGESPWELLRAQELEVDPAVVDFQLSGLRVNWSSSLGARHYTLDNVAVDAGGHVVAEEVKASSSYFFDPDYLNLMDLAATSLNAVSIKFNKVDADRMRRNRRRRANVAKAFDDRFASFGPHQLEVVKNAFCTEREGVALGQLSERLALPSSTALQVINAMMCMRHLSYDFDHLVGPDTQIKPAPKLTTRVQDIRAIRH